MSASDDYSSSKFIPISYQRFPAETVSLPPISEIVQSIHGTSCSPRLVPLRQDDYPYSPPTFELRPDRRTEYIPDTHSFHPKRTQSLPSLSISSFSPTQHFDPLQNWANLTYFPNNNLYPDSSFNSNATSLYNYCSRPPLDYTFPQNALASANGMAEQNSIQHITKSFYSIRKLARRRTKTGCLTCRKRRIKCDEGKPTCNNCQKSRRQCTGYSSTADRNEAGSATDT